MSQILKQSEKGEKEHEHGCIQYINTQSAIFRQLYYEDGGERMEETAREKREREARMRELFESVDDYVEQA